MKWSSPNAISVTLFLAFLIYIVARGEYVAYWRLAFPIAGRMAGSSTSTTAAATATGVP